MRASALFRPWTKIQSGTVGAAAISVFDSVVFPVSGAGVASRLRYSKMNVSVSVSRSAARDVAYSSTRNGMDFSSRCVVRLARAAARAVKSSLFTAFSSRRATSGLRGHASSARRAKVRSRDGTASAAIARYRSQPPGTTVCSVSVTVWAWSSARWLAPISAQQKRTAIAARVGIGNGNCILLLLSERSLSWKTPDSTLPGFCIRGGRMLK